MEIKKVKGNTFCIDTGMTYIPFYKINDEEIIMLDSGRAQGEREGIDELLQNNNFKVAGIICSHAHIDHVGNNAYFKEKYNCVISMSAHEAFICSSIVNLKVYYSNQTLIDIKEHFSSMICETDIKISNDINSVRICGINFQIMHTPGHSPSHICIITPDDVAYLGDAIISHEVMNEIKIPYTYILRSDLKSKENLHNLKCSKYVLAHKGTYDDITNLIDDNIKFYENMAKKIYSIIDSSMTIEEIFKTVIKNFNISVKSVHRYKAIERMLKSYVEYLNETGKIELNIEDGFLKYSKTSRNTYKEYLEVYLSIYGGNL
ncbi:MBL fold metallo-hydrolase [Clostridium sp. P21]|uniref:MBL fold metallo-hydrolase n=1 Tax=Clostridium muellerianum TaxID=2716538 RepID=A0A7Y0EH98_9CLOT|nr:MBL fold metallo-hydrolase [Clostridium muellerianum]NMM63454.1 MBL fold metallo-hydrolase [Clostridium muellerianum]